MHRDIAPFTVTLTWGVIAPNLPTYGVTRKNDEPEFGEFLITSMVFPPLRLLPAVEMVSFAPGQPVQEMTKTLLTSGLSPSNLSTVIVEQSHE